MGAVEVTVGALKSKALAQLAMVKKGSLYGRGNSQVGS